MVEGFIPREILSDPAEGETIIAEGVSFENFLKYFGEQHTEWLMGKVINVVSNNTQHNLILGFLYNVLSLFLGLKAAGRILLAGVPMHIADDRPAREPDLLIVLNENRQRIKATYLDGPADIAVEIVSPESHDRDRGRKMREYEAAGVREYWLFDPLRTEAVIYGLGGDGHYHPVPGDEHGRLISTVLPGFALDPALMWRDEPPSGAELIELVQAMVKD
jgi:Uma2 family endonuclease